MRNVLKIALLTLLIVLNTTEAPCPPITFSYFKGQVYDYKTGVGITGANVTIGSQSIVTIEDGYFYRQFFLVLTRLQ